MTDQNSQFFAILTAVGEAKQANAAALGTSWTFAQMGVGDANETSPIPNRLQTKLINERRRAPLNQVKVDPTNPSVIIAEQVIPESVGGWWVRELALYDTDGDMVAVANCAPTYKPLLAQGSGRTQVIRINLIVSSTTNIELKIDPSVVLATREYVDTSVIEALAKLDFKHSVLVATTANIVLSGIQTVDGVLLTADARVLVKDQALAKDNGIYVVPANGAWRRAQDADASVEVTPGLFVSVEKGTANGDSVWQLVTDAPIVLGTTALTFEVVAGRTGIVAGTYRSLTVDKAGRVIAGTNPTTLAGAGITDAYTKPETASAIQQAVAALVASSPAALDTLKELATALGNDPNFATTMTNALAGKAAIVDVVRNKTDGTVDTATDWNTLSTPGRNPKLLGGDNPNGPNGVAGAFFYADVISHTPTAYTVIATPFASSWEGAGSLYFRSFNGGTWFPWRTIQHSGHYALKTEAEAGTASKLLMSPLAVSQAIASHAPPGFISGLSLAVNAITPNTDIDVEVGRARDSTDAVDLILAGGLTKRLQAAGAWSAGAGGNALFTGAKVANTFYHAFLIRRDSDGAIDFGLDTSLIAANRPAAYGKFTRLKGRGVRTDATGNVIPFVNTGNSTDFKTLQQDMFVSNVATTSYTLTASVPPGVRVRARFYARVQGESPVIYVRSPDAAAVTLNNPATDSFVGGIGTTNDSTANENTSGYCEALTNQSGQVVVQVHAYPGYNVLRASLHTQGWTEE